MYVCVYEQQESQEMLVDDSETLEDKDTVQIPLESKPLHSPKTPDSRYHTAIRSSMQTLWLTANLWAPSSSQTRSKSAQTPQCPLCICECVLTNTHLFVCPLLLPSPLLSSTVSTCCPGTIPLILTYLMKCLKPLYGNPSIPITRTHSVQVHIKRQGLSLSILLCVGSLNFLSYPCV